MIRWFGYGFALTMGMFVACAMTERYDQWQRNRSDDEAMFV